jgi:3-oxoacyl-[acyl-carrier protein] reductase
VTLVVVTGASRGIGRATALALAERGCDLALIGRSTPRLDAVLAELEARSNVAHAFFCDLADRAALAAAAARLLAKHGAPDAVIHNAGIIHRAPIEALSVEAFDEQLAVNLRAPFILTQQLLPAMRARRSGRVVHVASISATIGTAGAAAYCASKWGMVGLMKSLAEELTGSGLMTVAVLPGSVDTEMLQGSGFAPRMTAEDVAKTLVHYALDAPVAHNGAIIEMFGV